MTYSDNDFAHIMSKLNEHYKLMTSKLEQVDLRGVEPVEQLRLEALCRIVDALEDIDITLNEQ